jgi:hypothetical protein
MGSLPFKFSKKQWFSLPSAITTALSEAYQTGNIDKSLFSFRADAGDVKLDMKLANAKS